MWSSKTLRRLPHGVFLALGLSAATGGCGVQPLYGTLGPGVLASELRAVKIEPISDRIGHYVENDLRLAFNGTGEPTKPKYRLVVKIMERVQAPIVDTVTARATAATTISDASYELYLVDGPVTPISKGVAYAAADYDRFMQRIANVRAAEESEIRNAQALAEEIRTQVAAILAART